MDKMTDSNSESMNSDEKDNSEYNPFDSVISTIDSYIKNPKMVTPQTLSELKVEVEQIKNSYEGEESDEGEPTQGEGEEKPSLTVVIGKMKHGGKENA